MCIYLGDKGELNYDSAEHIIPAGIGGIAKLPLDYVSREFNAKSSKYEQTFMRSSIIAVPRQLIGPGKRGSTAPTKATKSSVQVFRQHPKIDVLSLGYIELGKPIEIPHIVFNSETGEFTVNIDKNATQIEVANFKNQLLNFSNLRKRMIEETTMDANTFIIGIKTGVEENANCFIASKNGSKNPFDAALLSQISELIKSKESFSSSTKSHIGAHQKIIIDNSFYYCCAKISFNFLAYLNGKEFMTQKCFDPLRSWIVNGGNNDFVTLSPNQTNTIQEIFPQDSHQIFITKTDSSIVADICFYNHFHIGVKLADNYQMPFVLRGFICDWKNKIEYDLYDYLSIKKINKLNNFYN